VGIYRRRRRKRRRSESSCLFAPCLTRLLWQEEGGEGGREWTCVMLLNGRRGW